ncbi:fibronectin type III domain-containing protein [Candidatus Pacearchaeota archaeon]|nr:fibronectin type III domain-containing protein [Candidatus Pacearchaeota archaeon]
MKRSYLSALIIGIILVVILLGLYGANNKFRITANAILGFGSPVESNATQNSTNLSSQLPPAENKTKSNSFVETSASTASSGGSSSSSSDTQINVQETIPLQSPLNLVATATGSRIISLAWENNDTAYNIIIERSSGSQVEQIAVTDGSSSTYNDSNLAPETSYTYKVIAIRGGENAGSNHAEATTWMLGDLNNDGSVTISDFIDLCALYMKINTTEGFNPNADMNNDGIINMTDFNMMNSAFNGIDPLLTELGDINGDHSVSISDFIDLAASIGTHQEDTPTDEDVKNGYVYRAEADLNSDRVIDIIDFAMFKYIFEHKTMPPSPIPTTPHHPPRPDPLIP